MRMGAKPRTRVAGMYHVWGNAVAGSDLFIDPLDYLFALELVSEAVDRGGFDCNALCFVDTHYHLLVSTARDELLSTRMQRINRRCAIRCNRKYGRRGHVFDGPFESEPVVSDRHLMELTRYLALQTEPGIAAEAHLWSSYPGLV